VSESINQSISTLLKKCDRKSDLYVYRLCGETAARLTGTQREWNIVLCYGVNKLSIMFSYNCA
jgi:hypothetical protein